MDLEELFANFKTSAFRVEGLSSYAVEEEVEAIDYFNRTGSIPPEFNNEWASMVEEIVRSGRSIQRLRLVSDPLSPYETFELAAYRAGIAAGEEIRFAPRGSDVPPDFWLFDDRWVGVMNYSETGEWLSATVTDTLDTESPVDFEHWKSVFRDSASVAPSA